MMRSTKIMFDHSHFHSALQNYVSNSTILFLLFDSIQTYIYTGLVIDRWIRHHFSRTKRAKCLILIGPSGVGKTSFALSLPGKVNYFQHRWNLDQWNDYARYSVYDDIPWDDFSKLNFPNKKGLLTQNGRLNVSINGD